MFSTTLNPQARVRKSCVYVCGVLMDKKEKEFACLSHSRVCVCVCNEQVQGRATRHSSRLSLSLYPQHTFARTNAFPNIEGQGQPWGGGGRRGV